MESMRSLLFEIKCTVHEMGRIRAVLKMQGSRYIYEYCERYLLLKSVN